MLIALTIFAIIVLITLALRMEESAYIYYNQDEEWQN
jgi:hypothetical protein